MSDAQDRRNRFDRVPDGRALSMGIFIWIFLFVQKPDREAVNQLIDTVTIINLKEKIN